MPEPFTSSTTDQSAPSPHTRRGHWLCALLLIIALATAIALACRQANDSRQQLRRLDLERNALLFAYALQHSADDYARHLASLQTRLSAQPVAARPSLLEQWRWSSAESRVRAGHPMRVLPLTDPVWAEQAQRLTQTETETDTSGVRGFASHEALMLVAIPSSSGDAVSNPAAHAEEATGLELELLWSQWLREVQRAAGLEALQVRIALPVPDANPADTPLHTTSPRGVPALHWQDGHRLTMTMRLAGAPVTVQVHSEPGVKRPGAGWQMLSLWMLMGVTALLAGWMGWQRMREHTLTAETQRYRDYAYKGWLRYFAFINHPMLPTAEIDRLRGQFLSLSPRFGQLLGYSQEAMKRLTLAAITHPADLERLRTPEVIHAQEADYEYSKISDVRLVHSLGHYVWVDVLKIRYEPTRTQAVTQSLTDRELIILLDQSAARTLQAQLQRRIQKNQKIFEQLPVGLCIADSQMHIIFANDRFLEYSGLARPLPETLDDWWQQAIEPVAYREKLLAHWGELTAAALASDGILPPMEITLSREGGAQRRSLEVSGIIMDDQMVLTLVDLTNHKKAEEEIRLLAFYDATTGLPNRRLLADRLQQALVTSQQHHWYGALLMLSLGKFRAIRDEKGQETSNAVLKEAVQRLQQALPKGQTIARTDTEEFAILLSGIASDELEAARICKDIGNRIVDALQEPFQRGDQRYRLNTCVGVTVYGAATSSAEELLRRADMALYQAKQTGESKPHFFDPEMQARSSARAALEEDIRAGIALGQFVLYFQPQVENHQVVGAEVLLRWRNGSEEFVSPDKFITTAEQSNLIIPLGNWVLAQACQQLAAWAKRPETAHLTLSVNVSPKQFKQDNFVQTVLQAIAHAGAPAHRLVIELTEGVLLEDIDQAIDRMARLNELGVGFSLDDFGTGYSSLSYLQRLPLTEVKIDRSFVQDLETKPGDASIVRTIISLGHSLGLKVIAEGVENASHIEYLSACGCFHWQGYYIGRPQPLHMLERMILEAQA